MAFQYVDSSRGLSGVQETRRAGILTLGFLAYPPPISYPTLGAGNPGRDAKQPGDGRLALAIQREHPVVGTPAEVFSPNHSCGMSLDAFSVACLSYLLFIFQSQIPYPPGCFCGFHIGFPINFLSAKSAKLVSIVCIQ